MEEDKIIKEAGKDQLPIALNWINQIANATALRTNGEKLKYINSVEILIKTLLKEDREAVTEEANKMWNEISKTLKEGEMLTIKGKLDFYDDLLQLVIDRLDEGGYFRSDKEIRTGSDKMPEEEE